MFHRNYCGSNGAIASEDLCDYLRIWLDEPGDRQLAILGGYGQGKSTGAMMFTYQMIQRLRPDQPSRIIFGP